MTRREKKDKREMDEGTKRGETEKDECFQHVLLVNCGTAQEASSPDLLLDEIAVLP